MTATDSQYIAALDRAIRLNKQLSASLDAAHSLVSQGNYEGSYQAGFDAVHLVEKLALLIRALPCYTGNPQAKKEVAAIIAEEVPIEAGFTDQGWFLLRMPILLPKKEKGSPEYIRGFLYPALKRIFRNAAPFRFQKVTIIFRHVYDYRRPVRRYRDHDNIEVNAAIDAIALHVLRDDHPLYCTHYYCCASGPKEFTEVYLIPKEAFSAWLSIEELLPAEGLEIMPPPDFHIQKHIEI